MKTHIRLIALVLAFLLALPLFGSSAIAADVSTGDLGANMTQTLLESTAIEVEKVLSVLLVGMNPSPSAVVQLNPFP